MKKMPTCTTRPIFALIIIMCAALGAAAQDIHFSQFYNTPANLNPALTGVFGGDLRFVGNYRNQWQSVPVPYRTFSGAFDTKLYHAFFGKTGYLGYGFVFNNDKAGDAELSLSQIGGNVAYTRQLSDLLFATVGVQFMAGQRTLKPEKLTFAEQWNGDEFDPSLAAGEVFAATSRSLTSLSTGLNLHYQMPGTRTKHDWGFGLFHLNGPKTSFYDAPDVTLPKKLNAYLMSTVQTGLLSDVRLNAIFSKQGEYQELVIAAAYRYHLNVEKHHELSLQGGFGFRPGDAFIPSAEVQVKNWTAGFSYDINISPFKAATLRRGGPELFIQCIIWRVKAPKEFKACPVF